jgi:o-succinylbenzoate synthase
MLHASFSKYTLEFKRPSGTSRGVLKTKESWFISLRDSDDTAVVGIGECALLKGLSIDDRPDYETKLAEVCARINEHKYWLESGLREFPSIHFGLEMALLDLSKQGSKQLFPNRFSQGHSSININGLIWMGEPDFMKAQITEKIDAGFRCIKLKIGAVDFEQEIALLAAIRQEFDVADVELRVDANGAFTPDNALEKLKRLSDFELHSIEQPIKAGQWDEMAQLCETTPLPIALDEELIGVFDLDSKTALIDAISPQYLILKPSLVGGFSGSMDWIDLADERQIPWWITSALESNIGLSAIAQWTYTFINTLPQGLGTGQLYTNNIPSPLVVENGKLHYRPALNWDLSSIETETLT